MEKILIDDDGRAVGVRLRDGREWKARLAVVSNGDPYATFVEMIGEDYLPRTFIERVKDIQADEFSYFQVHLALKAPVRYALHVSSSPAVDLQLNGSLLSTPISILPRCRRDSDSLTAHWFPTLTATEHTRAWTGDRRHTPGGQALSTTPAASWNSLAKTVS